MARLAPAACSPCAIAQAIERLFATPKTTAVRPFKSSNMKEVSSGKRITASLGCVGRTLLSAAFALAVALAVDLAVDLAAALALVLELIWELISISRINCKTNVNVSGQECPLHTNQSLATPPPQLQPSELSSASRRCQKQPHK